MNSSNKLRTGVTAAVCVAVGTAGGIAGSAAAPSKKKQTRQSTSTTTTTTPGMPPPPPPGAHRFGHRFGPGGRSVHSEEVVLNRAGEAYITETEDNGTVKSVSGDELTVTEGTDKVPYKDATVTITSGATIYRNDAKVALSALKAGDFVHVSQSSDGTLVFAVDPSFRPRFDGRGPGHGPGDRDRDHRGGPAGGPGPYGPPPAMG